MDHEATSDLNKTVYRGPSDRSSPVDMNPSIPSVQIVARAAADDGNPPAEGVTTTHPTDSSRGSLGSREQAESAQVAQSSSEPAQLAQDSHNAKESWHPDDLAQSTGEQGSCAQADEAAIEEKDSTQKAAAEPAPPAAQSSTAPAAEQADDAAQEKPEQGDAAPRPSTGSTSCRLLDSIPEEPASTPASAAPAEVTVDMTADMSSDKPKQEKPKREREQERSRPIEIRDLTDPVQLYARILIRCPCILLTCYLVFFGGLIGVLQKPLSFDISWDGFTEGNSQERLAVESWRHASRAGQSPVTFTSNRSEISDNPQLAMLMSNDVSAPTTAPPGQSNTTAPSATRVQGELQILYIAREGNALDEAMLWEIKKFEEELRSLASWSRMCNFSSEDDQLECNPGMSLVSVLWGQQEDRSRSMVKFDGTGQTPLNLAEVLGMLYVSGNHSRYFPSNMSLDRWAAGGQLSKCFALRSTFQFRGNSDIGYEDFALKEVLPFLKKRRHAAESFTIVYGGDHISQYEFWDAFYSDCLWSVGSMVFVITYMWLNTWSLMLSISGLLIILASIPLALGMMPSGDINVVNVFAVFLMLGIGADNLFVFTQFWAQSKEMSSKLEQRMAWAIRNSVVGCLATSLTTAASFLANLASNLRPLREFGFFVGMCVVGCYVMMCFMLPPILVLQESRCCGWCCEKIQRISEQAETRSRVLRNLGERRRKMCEPCLPQSEGTTFCDTSAVSKIAQKMLLAYCRRLASMPLTCLAVYFLVLTGFVVGIVFAVKVNLTMPDLLPDNHNYGMYQRLDLGFSHIRSSDRVLDKGMMCNPGLWNMEGCVAQRCEMGAKGIPMKARCYSSFTQRSNNGQSSNDLDGVNLCKSVKVHMRAAGRQNPTENVWDSLKLSYVQAMPAGNFSLDQDLPAVPTRLKLPLLLEDWESGQVETQLLYDTVRGTIERQSGILEDCEIHSICFLDEHRCDMPRWQLTGSFALPNATIVAPIQSVAKDSWPASVWVSVAWGLHPAEQWPLLGAPDVSWKYDEECEINSVWNQRALYQFCTEEIRRQFGSQVRNIDCWIADLRNWLMEQGRPFPSRSLAYDVKEWQKFSDQRDMMYNRSYSVLLDESKRKVILSEVKLELRLETSSDQAVVDALNDVKEFLREWNDQAPEGVNKAFAFSSRAVQAVTRLSIMSGTITTILIATVTAFVSMLVFTSSPILSLYVSLLVLGVVTSLLFFMSCIMQWNIGPVDVLALIIFVGYAVTYALHIAHSYHNVGTRSPMLWLIEAKVFNLAPDQRILQENRDLDDEDDDAASNILSMKLTRDVPQGRRLRVAKTVLALYRLGPAVLSSAVSTLGASCFLLGCTLTIFPKMGSVIVAVTIFSLVASIAVLPALLMVAGPTPTCCPGLSSLFPSMQLQVQEEPAEERRASSRPSRDHGRE